MKMNGDHEYLNGTAPPATASPRSSTHLATRTSVAWGERANALVPVLGHSGVTAIYLRALEYAETDWPWLYEVREQTQTPDPFAPLIARLSLCTPDTAAAVQASLLEQPDTLLNRADRSMYRYKRGPRDPHCPLCTKTAHARSPIPRHDQGTTFHWSSGHWPASPSGSDP